MDGVDLRLELLPPKVWAVEGPEHAAVHMIDAARATPRSGPRLRFMAILVPFVVRSFVHHSPQRGSEMGAYRAPVMASHPQATLLEPSLRRRFGADYQKYLRTVPGLMAAPVLQADHPSFMGPASTPDYDGTVPTDRLSVPKASAIRTAMSFFTSALALGLSIGKWSDPFVDVYLSVSLASSGMTDALCGR